MFFIDDLGLSADEGGFELKDNFDAAPGLPPLARRQKRNTVSSGTITCTSDSDSAAAVQALRCADNSGATGQLAAAIVLLTGDQSSRHSYIQVWV